jgi:YD repeat-containing protein
MERRLQILGAVIAVFGIIAIAGGAYGYTRYQAGADALQGFSDAQGVRLTYNDQGQLIDRGTTEQADAILALLRDEWKWPVVAADLNPNDPLVDTGTEYMYQMATIAYHTLHGEQEVTLAQQVAFDGDGDGTVAADAAVYTPATLPQGEEYVATIRQDAVFEPGTYTVPIAERYWSGFNRLHPLDGQAREAAWTGTVHGLFAQLGVGATTASSLELAQALTLMLAGFGILFLITGLGLVWVGAAARVRGPEASTRLSKAPTGA